MIKETENRKQNYGKNKNTNVIRVIFKVSSFNEIELLTTNLPKRIFLGYQVGYLSSHFETDEFKLKFLFVHCFKIFGDLKKINAYIIKDISNTNKRIDI